MRKLSLIMVLTLLASAGINGYYGYQLFGKPVIPDSKYTESSAEEKEIQADLAAYHEKLQAEKESGFVSYIPVQTDSKNLDEVIANEQDSMNVLLHIQNKLGITDAANSYKYTGMRSNDYYDTYTMQQYYNGIEVYGYQLKMTADKSGRLVSVNGMRALIKSLDTASEINSNEAYNYLLKHLKTEYQFSPDDVQVESRGEMVFSVNDEFILGYAYNVQSFTEKMVFEHFIVVNAVSKEVCIDSSMIAAEKITLNSDTNQLYHKLQGQQVSQTLDVWKESDEEYILRDNSRNIFVQRVKFEALNRMLYSEISWNPQEGNLDKKYANAVDALANLERVYDFYLDNFSRIGVHDSESSRLDVYVNVSKYENNAAMGPSGNSLYIGPATDNNIVYSAYLDVMGHEYTHGILYDYGVNPVDNTPANAIHEGLADIFGELIEDYCDDGFNGSCNWIAGPNGDGRDIRNLQNASHESSNGYLLSYADYQNHEDHRASTLVSYPAYLMTHSISNVVEDGDSLNNSQLAILLYNSFQNLTSSTSFKAFRTIVQQTALLMNENNELTDRQLERVIDAFDRVAIPRSASLLSMTPDAVIRITDTNGVLYKDYDYTISKCDETVVLSGSGKSADPYLHLENRLAPGIYNLVIYDKNMEGVIRAQEIIVNNNVDNPPNGYQEYDSTPTINTAFGSQAKEIVLALDCSGSMEGTPLAELKQAADSFIDTIFSVNPNSTISIVRYSAEADCMIVSSDPNELHNAVHQLSAGGKTNTRDAISVSKTLLDNASSLKKYLLIMSDGLPTWEPDMLQVSKMIQDSETLICSLGFFHNLDSSNLNQGIECMRSLASPGYYYNVQDTADLQGVFNDIARQFGGERYVQLRVACPVDVTVRYNGETLSSADGTLNTRTSFGNLLFEGENNEIKVLRLNEDADYEICITGTGTGTMDYSISFADENGDYTDIRSFDSIPITPQTVISTSSSSSHRSVLNVDSDGDGHFDLYYYAGQNKTARNSSDTRLLIIFALFVVFVLAVFVSIIRRIVKTVKYNKYCQSCGARIINNANYCIKCGAKTDRIKLFAHPDPTGRKASRAIRILQVTVIGICLAVTASTTLIYRSAANTVYRQIQQTNLLSASVIFERNVSDSDWACRYLNWVVKPYLDKVSSANESQRIHEAQAFAIYEAVSQMKLGTASELAEKLLEDAAEQQ